MADKYIDKIKKDGQEYDIHDKRVDSLSSGTKLYKHVIELSYDTNASITVTFVTNRKTAITVANDSSVYYILRSFIYNGITADNNYFFLADASTQQITVHYVTYFNRRSIDGVAQLLKTFMISSYYPGASDIQLTCFGADTIVDNEVHRGDIIETVTCTFVSDTVTEL